MNDPGVGIAAIVHKDKKILLCKRQGAHGEDSWGFPGGKLEFGESWKECAKRETREEARIEIENVDYLTTTNDIFGKDNKHFVTIFMRADYKSGEVKIMEPNKCQKWKWFDSNSLPNNLFLPIHNLLKQGIKL